MKTIFDYSSKFKPVTWMRYYILLLIFILSKDNETIITFLVFMFLYFLLALSMVPLNYKIIPTNTVGKTLYWTRVILKILSYFISMNLQVGKATKMITTFLRSNILSLHLFVLDW